jgi:hypothetical protein
MLLHEPGDAIHHREYIPVSIRKVTILMLQWFIMIRVDDLYHELEISIPGLTIHRQFDEHEGIGQKRTEQ